VTCLRRSDDPIGLFADLNKHRPEDGLRRLLM
jgi:hypothetical protein